MAARAVVPDAHDPFRLSSLSPTVVKDDPARLADELGALAFCGGRRVVHLSGAADGISGAIQSALGVASDALLIVEAGELGPRSSLRKLFEGGDQTGLAVPCYDDSAESAEAMIQTHLGRLGGAMADDAAALLIERTSGDRAQLRGELDKLTLYVGGGGAERFKIERSDVEAAIGDGGALSLDQVCDAIALGDLAALDRAVVRAAREGLHAISLLRSVTRHLMRLHLAAARVAGGQSVDAAMASLRPPIFFAVQPAFRRQLAQWSPGRLAEALQLLLDAEADCKSTGVPAEAVCARTLLRIAGAARSGRAAG